MQNQLTVVRHGQSFLNERRKIYTELEEFKKFKELLKQGNIGPAQALARKLEAYCRQNPVSDPNCGITHKGRRFQARPAGKALRQLVETPDVIFCSPYTRAQETLECLRQSWHALHNAETHTVDALREHQLGEIHLYGDYEVFFALNPDQKKIKELMTWYYYKPPGGESPADVRQRVGTWFDIKAKPYLTEFNKPDKNILIVAHWGTMLALHSHINGLDFKEYLEIDEATRRDTFNCSVNRYLFKNGKLVESTFNEKIY